MPAEPLTDVLAFLEVPQLVGPGHRPIRIDPCHQGLDPVHPFPALGTGLRVEELGPQRLHRDPTAGDGEALNAVEQQVLGGRRQIRHQPLGRPHAGRRRVKPGLPQRFRPVVAQIHRHGDPVAGGLRPVFGQGGLLEFQHPGWSSS